MYNLERAAREKFWLFCLYYDITFFKDRGFLKTIAIELQKIAEGHIRKLAISMPPRAGKSYVSSLFCAWILGNNPKGCVMRNSCTETLYLKFSYDVREIIKQPQFQAVFPGVELADDRQNLKNWSLKGSTQGSYFGAGVGGTIIGSGATLAAITDDLYRGHEDALSEAYNEKVHRWHSSSHGSRLEGNCPIVDIGTRWSKRDVIGSTEYDSSIIVPALINGKSFCESVRSTERYLEVRDTTDPFIWNSEYMQQPIELEGIMFPMDQLKRYTELNEEGVQLAFTDTADEGTDHFCTLFGRLVGHRFYVTDAIYNLRNLLENEEILLERLTLHKVDRNYIETNAAGAYFFKNMKQKWTGQSVGQHNFTNKMGRILAQAGWILENFYWPAKPSPELQLFINEMCNLLKTGSKHDDAPDCTAGMAMRIRRDYLNR